MLGGFSVPWVRPVLLVVQLQLDLILYLVHEDLGQQDPHQLQRRKQSDPELGPLCSPRLGLPRPLQSLETHQLDQGVTWGMARPSATPPSRKRLLCIQLTSLSMQPLV